MPATDLDNQLLLIQRVGDVDIYSGDPVSPFTAGTNGIIMINADRIWMRYADRLTLSPASLAQQIFDSYFMITGAQLVLGILRARVDFSAVGTAMRVMLSQRTKSYENLLGTLMTALADQEQRLGAFASPQVRLLTTIEPIAPPVPGQLSSPTGNPFILDGNDPSLLGSVYWSSWRKV